MAKNEKNKTSKKIVENNKDNKGEKEKNKTISKKDNSKSSVKKANNNINKKNKSSKESIDTNKKNKSSKKSIDTNKKNESRFSENSELTKLIKIVLIVTAIMLVFYLITLVATNKADKVNEETASQDEKETTEIQYDYIMIGTLFSREGTFYVLIEEDEDNRLSEYSTLIETAKANEDVPTIYKANLTDSFNKGYLSKESNYEVNDIADFRVTGTTLVKIDNGKISETYDSYESIKTKLTELSK